MAVYRNAAETIVELYDFDWKDNERMKEACICSVEGMIANILDVAIVFLFAALMGVFWEMLIFFITFAAMRFYAGGAHAKNYVRCVTTYISIMCASVWVARLCSTLPDVYTIMICAIGILLSGWISEKYAGKQRSMGSQKTIYRRNALVIHKVISAFMIMSCIAYPHMNYLFLKKMIWLQALALIAHGVALFINRQECVD